MSDIERWWPAGHGTQPLYDVEIALLDDGTALDSATRRVGFRDLRWDTTADASGTPFTLFVNDRPIYVKGVNWIPDDAVPEQSRPGSVPHPTRAGEGGEPQPDPRLGRGGSTNPRTSTISPTSSACWSGRTSCSPAPRTRRRIPCAPRSRRKRGRTSHASLTGASLALLTGNNENTWGYEDWGWKTLLDGKTWGAHYYYELFPAIIDELAPHVPYAPGSPFSPGAGWDGASADRPASERRGARHHAPVGAVEPAGLADVPQPSPPVRRRVRVAGAAHVVDTDAVHSRTIRSRPTPPA